MLRQLLLISLFVLALPGCARARHKLPPEPPQPLAVTTASLNTRPPIGALGVPLGVFTEIRATIVSGNDLRVKDQAGGYFLQVFEVAGRSLPQPQILPYEAAPGSAVALPVNLLELTQFKTGKEPDQLTNAQVDSIERAYVGTNVRLVVYETGGFSGVPLELPPGVGEWQGHAFSFSTGLVVLIQRP